MHLVLLILLLLLHYLTPLEVHPLAAEWRVLFWLSLVGALAGIVGFLMRPTLYRYPQIYLCVGLIGAVGLSRAGTGWLGGAYLGVVDFGLRGIILVLAAVGIKSFLRLRIISLVLLSVCLYFAISCMFAYYADYRYDTFILLEGLNYTPTGGYESFLPRIRGLGTLNDPNDLAQMFLVVLPLQFIWWRGGKIRKLLYVIVPSAVILYGVYLTHSRGGILGLSTIMLAAGWTKLGKRGLVFGILGVLVVLTVYSVVGVRGLGSSDASSQGRFDAWGGAFEMLRSSPLWGIGYGMFRDNFERTAHNSFALCFAELGMIGYFFWTGLVVTTYKDLNWLARLQPDTPFKSDVARYANLIRLSFTSFLVTAWFLSRTYVVILYVLMGMAIALREIAQNGGLQPNENEKGLPWQILTPAVQFAAMVLIYVSIRLR